MFSRLKLISQKFTSVFSMSKFAWQAHPISYIGLILLTVLQGGLPLATAWTTKLLFDLLAASFSGTSIVAWSQLIMLLIIQAVLAIVTQMSSQVHRYLNAELSRKVTIEIQTTIYEKINSFNGIAYFENPQLYDTIRLAKDGARFGTANTLSMLTGLIQSLITLFGFLGILLTFNPLLVGLIILASIPQLYAQFKFGHQRFDLVNKFSSDERKKAFYEFILSNPVAVKEVRLFNSGEYLLGKLLKLFEKVHTAERHQQQYELYWQLILNVLSSLIASIAFVIVILTAFAGRLSLGDITLYVSAVISIQGALARIINSISGINEGALFYSYFIRLLALQQPLPLAKFPHLLRQMASGIELRHVSFRYSEQHPWILKDVNLYIAQGHSLALVGLNGAGKTTLVKLLLRLYDPTEGQILWDGIDIRQFDPVELRQRISAVFQDFMRYDLTAQENIGLGNISYIEDLEKIKSIAMMVGIHHKIEQLRQGYQTQLSLMFGDGRSVVDFSGGEWQKISIARALMRNADLLILDEPTAALDAQAEYEMHNKFVNLVSGRTCILISHRFSTVLMADSIAVLEDGKISEHGSHEQLLSLGGTYAKLYTMQAEKYQANGKTAPK